LIDEGRRNNDLPCLELRGVTKRFTNVVAVDRVSIQVEKGELFSLLGPSGCGKTTTLRLIGGLETPDEGDVLIDGKIVNDLPPYKRDSSIVFQNLALFPHMTVKANISFGLERRRVAKPEVKRKVQDALELVKLAGMEDRRPDQLSGGQQQRVALARSLVLNPKVLLLDEPLASLDRKLRKEMQVELKRIQEEVGTTFIYVTHDQKVALSLSDRIAVMKSGKLVQIGTPDEVFECPKTRFVADFMGAANIFSGEATFVGDGRIQLETEEGLRIFCLENEGTEVEDIASVSVRPEAIRITKKGSDWAGDNKFIGKIIEEVYQGDFTEYEISLESDGDLTVHWSGGGQSGRRERFAKGEKVIVGWELEDSNTLVG
jgi:spermidine/putrescine transport system ATP-binding protein